MLGSLVGSEMCIGYSSGIVPHSERLERFTLWPLGIESPGAMRQWGTHATAFVGEAHFDEPFLIDEAFAR